MAIMHGQGEFECAPPLLWATCSSAARRSLPTQYSLFGGQSGRWLDTTRGRMKSRKASRGIATERGFGRQLTGAHVIRAAIDLLCFVVAAGWQLKQLSWVLGPRADIRETLSMNWSPVESSSVLSASLRQNNRA